MKRQVTREVGYSKTTKRRNIQLSKSTETGMTSKMLQQYEKKEKKKKKKGRIIVVES